MKLLFRSFISAAIISLLYTFPAFAQTVKITPLGSHDGEFCSRDRAMLFEDPDGTTLLFDVGRTVAGPGDSRLGNVDVVLLSGMHGDHFGDKRIEKVGDGTCAKPKTEVQTVPNSNTAEIIVGKNAQAFLGGEMHKFLQNKVKAAGGSAKQVGVLRFGGERKVGGVRIAIVPVTHSNGIGSGFLDKELGDLLNQNGLTAYAGPDNGYILTFSNGLVVYLSGDSGIFADQDVTVRGFYGAELAIINAGGIFTSGPKEAAYSISKLIQPKAVIPHHMNEAATENGKLKPDSKTAIFNGLIKDIPVHIPLSGRTMEFDGNGTCLSGC
ncbi:MBL fold metallo-hydrolase [Desulfopila sp. IMCC35008]|uniref:MBL fold metallo-hydrolase n=1 Tax=Desulfopila sp. IMCC35008 TaxID=2653858 RepID=UPI0013D0EC2E|nr:MBL fold metallo-hydrolase [Desulfopila sp. IMCC35008]